MAFSVFGILAVIIEALRPLLSFFLIWLVIDLIATALTLRQRRFAHARARQWAIRAGLVFAVGAFLAGPWLTQANFADFIGLVDWLLLALMALAVGFIGFILTLPVVSLIRS